jgi:hypothetical protein
MRARNEKPALTTPADESKRSERESTEIRPPILPRRADYETLVEIPRSHRVRLRVALVTYPYGRPPAVEIGVLWIGRRSGEWEMAPGATFLRLDEVERVAAALTRVNA